MNEPHLAHLIRQNLNRSARALPEDVVARLRQARGVALTRQKRSLRGALLASAGALVTAEESPRRTVAVVILVAALLGGLSYWHSQQYIAGLADVDSAILTDDMPLGAIVDNGFDAWLRDAAEH